MAASLAQSVDESPAIATWCSVLLDHLEEFATLAWYLVADGKLVEHTFARTMAQLDTTAFDTTAFDASVPSLAYDQVRNLLITQAISVLEETRREEDGNQSFQPTPFGELPDLPRLAFMLRMVVCSSTTQVAEFLDVTPSKVQELVSHAINHLSTNSLASLLSDSREA
jgi:DNA-directed RNA polymerase specialized sigma24 family protein